MPMRLARTFRQFELNAIQSRGVGIRFNGMEKNLDRFGNPMTIRLKGKVEWRRN